MCSRNSSQTFDVITPCARHGGAGDRVRRSLAEAPVAGA